MKRLSLACGLALVLSGCATPSVVDPALSSYQGVEVESDSNGAKFLESFTFNYPLSRQKDGDLEFCVAQNVENRGVSLTGETSSYISPFTGIRYADQDTREAGGGQVVRFVNEDGSELVADGMTSYQFNFGMAPIERAVRYKLSAQHQEDELTLMFSSLDQAQTDTGAMANSGFDRLGAWKGSGAKHAYLALESVADNINSCLSNR